MENLYFSILICTISTICVSILMSIYEFSFIDTEEICTILTKFIKKIIVSCILGLLLSLVFYGIYILYDFIVPYFIQMLISIIFGMKPYLTLTQIYSLSWRKNKYK